MPRKIIPLITDELYHIYNRGADKRDIFMDKGDYLRFYQTLNFFNEIDPVKHFSTTKNKKDSKAKLVEVKAYALLPNHYHLLVKQLVDGGVSEYLKRVSGGYTSYFNQKQKRSGVLFQGKFKRVHIETDEQLNYLVAYVNENLTVHGIKFDNEICYSSSLHYQGVARSILLSEVVGDYSVDEAKKLAQEIYVKRQLLKVEKLLD